MYIFGNTPFFYNLICKRYEAFVVTSRYVGICFVDKKVLWSSFCVYSPPLQK